MKHSRRFLGLQNQLLYSAATQRQARFSLEIAATKAFVWNRVQSQAPALDRQATYQKKW
jgi:hypothetical protein